MHARLDPLSDRREKSIRNAPLAGLSPIRIRFRHGVILKMPEDAT